MDQLQKKVVGAIIKDNCPLFQSLAQLAANGAPKSSAMNIVAKMPTAFSRNAWALVVDFLYSKEGETLLNKAASLPKNNQQ